eukprot:4521549-Karenia_brevis.AAC.1
MSGDQRSGGTDNAHKVLGALWFAHALLKFLPASEVMALEWSEYWSMGQLVNDEWLLGLRAKVRQQFIYK